MIVVGVAVNATRPSKIEDLLSLDRWFFGGVSTIIPVPSRLPQPTGEKRNRHYNPLMGMNRMVLWVLRGDSHHVV
jgi:hypothetical protein